MLADAATEKERKAKELEALRHRAVKSSTNQPDDFSRLRSDLRSSSTSPDSGEAASAPPGIKSGSSGPGDSVESTKRRKFGFKKRKQD
jgi:hypothetical protein